jgi:hypothetical protein
LRSYKIIGIILVVCVLIFAIHEFPTTILRAR